MRAEYSVDDLLAQMGAAIEARLAQAKARQPLMVGIHTGGVRLAERLHRALGLSEPLGRLNISFYRDDFTRIGVHPQVKPSHLPVDVEGRDILLVDDVLHTGRTIRAALNEIFDYGRPARVWLAVLVDRDGRELPIQADVVGVKLALAEGQQVKLSGPEPLNLNIVQAGVREEA